MRKATFNIAKLKVYAIENYKSVNKFASVIGVSNSRLYAFLKGEQKASGKMWSSLVGYFGESILDYISFFDG